ncbi:MAG: hypothetical protein IKX47_04420 [Oscillospiraceae bacterium]|nr:hypothetical protein [Oscillospiraceae bacterium]
MKHKRFLSVLLALVMVFTLLPVLTPPAKAAGSVTIDSTNFPDTTFRNYISDVFDNGDGVLSAAEIAAVTTITVSNMDITTLKGIEYFTALKDLRCVHTKLTTLTLSKNTALEELRAYYNYQLTNVTVSGLSALSYLDVEDCTALKTLACSRCALNDLCIDGCTALTSLECGNNQLTELDVSDCTALTALRCYSNRLTSLDVSKNTALDILYCQSNPLTELDLTKNTALEYLAIGSSEITSIDLSNNYLMKNMTCISSKLTELDVSKSSNLESLSVENSLNLTELRCYECALKTLNVSGCTALTYLDCEDNYLTSLNVRSCTALETLFCRGNKLTELDVEDMESLNDLRCIGNPLEGVYCCNTALTSLNVSDCSNLINLYCQCCQINYLNVSGCTALKELVCYENRLTSLDLKDCTELTYLEAERNQLSSLNLTNNMALVYLNVAENQLKTLDVADHSSLKYLYVSDNLLLTELNANRCGLTSLDVTGCTALESLYCGDCWLESLDISDCAALKKLNCYYNTMMELDVSSCKGLTWLDCAANYITSLDISACANLVDVYLNTEPDPPYDFHGFQVLDYHNEDRFLSVNDDTKVITDDPPVISSVKANKTSANAGEKITWTAYANAGYGDLQYYFILYKDGTKLKTRSYSTKNTYSYTPTEAGTYKVKVYVKDSAGRKVYKTSKGVTVTAVAAPVITTQPKAQTAAAGATATFKVVASGTGLTYQWQYSKDGTNWTNKTGATSASYTVTAKASYNGLYYRCKVSNAGGSVYSNKAKLTVTSAVSKPEITTQPKAQTAAAGETATFKVVASGTGLTYQWQYSTDYGKTWHDKTGSTKATHTVTVKASYNGYLYRCKVTNSAGTVYSSKVRLTVSGVKPKILSQPAAQTAAAGESVTFKVVAAGVGMTYQWQYKTAGSSTWKDKTGATSASYTVTAKASYNGIQYRCVVKNSIGSVTSEEAKLTVK